MTPEQKTALEALRGEPLTDEQVAQIDPLIAARRDPQIAAVLGEGLVRYRQPYYVGEGTISDTIGLPAGPIFVQALVDAAAAPLPDNPTYQDRANSAMIRQAWRLLSSGRLDLGLPSVRGAIIGLVGVLPISAQDAARVCALPQEPAPINVYEVSEALNNA